MIVPRKDTRKTVFLTGILSTTLNKRELSLITTDRETEKETTLLDRC